MPETINPKLLSWASEIDPETIRQAEKTARLPIVEGCPTTSSRCCTASSGARWAGEHNGPEALTVERPAETRQGEVRAVPGPRLLRPGADYPQ